MAKTIVAADAAVMNSLYATEVAKIAGEQKVKIATPEDPQAFKDHADYNATVEAVLRSDGSEEWNPNDPLKD
jgi:hypothetical protein